MNNYEPLTEDEWLALCQYDQQNAQIFLDSGTDPEYSI